MIGLCVAGGVAWYLPQDQNADHTISVCGNQPTPVNAMHQPEPPAKCHPSSRSIFHAAPYSKK